MRNERDLIVQTPEHVEIRLSPAGLGSRFLAVTADSILVLGLSGSIRMLLMSFLPQGVAWAVSATVAFVLTWGYHVYFETRHQGRSPGKRITGLRVVDARGLPISVQQSMVRNIVRILDFAPVFYGLGATVTMFDRYRRRLGDIVADTLVIREADALELTPQLAATARRITSLRTPRIVRLIRHRITLEEREFLVALCLRAEQLEPEARYDLMEQVAAAYRDKLGIDDPHLSGENLVRALTAMLFSERTAT